MSKQKYPQSSTTTAGGEAAGKGRKSYSHAKLDARIDKRRQEAMARQREYSKLTKAQKIERAKSRRGESKRELARLGVK